MKLKEHSSYIIAFCATVVRYYDYALFGLSSSMMSKNFMPGIDNSERMLGFFGMFSIAMWARPLGSIIFGKIGDKIGRIASVKISTALAAITTILIAFIPSFDSIGWLAVILLTLCRMLFLASLAGEVDAIKIYVAEKVGRKKRHFATGIVSFSSQIGVLLAAIMYHIAISAEEIISLWRGNFLLGGFLGFIIVLFREHLKEDQAFLRSKSRASIESDKGVYDIIGSNKLKFLFALVVNGMLGGSYHFIVIFFGTFFFNVAGVITQEQATSGNIIVIFLHGIASLLSGYIADKINIVRQISTALTCSIISVLVLVGMLEMGVFIRWLHYLIAFTAPFYTIPCSIKIQSLFLTGVRMRMFSLSHSMGSILLSSTTPFLCMLIWELSGEISLVIAYFLIQLMILFGVLVMISKKDYENMFET